jgi:hypothetical protein
MARRTKAVPALKLAPVVQLKPKADKSLTDYLVGLSVDAFKGDVTGVVVGVLHKSGGYTLRVLGEAENTPTYCLGMVEMLKANLVDRVINR